MIRKEAPFAVRQAAASGRIAMAAVLLSLPALLVVAQDQNADPNQQQPNDPNAAQPEPKPADEPLPKLADLPVPEAATLLTQPPVDWLVLNDDSVLVVEPVSPRPNTLQQLEQAIIQLDAQPAPRSKEDRDARAEERRKLQRLSVTLPRTQEAENPEFEIQTRHIKQIVHHEDLMLRRVDEFIRGGQLREAFEMLFSLERRLPDWPGIDRRRNDILFAEVGLELKDEKFEQALVRLEELHGRDRRYPQLQQMLGEVANKLISAAVEDEDFRRAHHFLERLRQLEPAHEMATRWRNEFTGRSAQLLEEARAASSGGRYDEAVYLAERAVRAWPLTSPADRDVYRRILDRFQRLKVGVLALPDDPTPYFLPTDADIRERHLTEAQLFDVDRVDAVPHFRSRFLEHWQPNDLGRETVFTLRQDRAYWESSPVVSAMQAVDTLAAKLDPTSKHFDERLASYVDSLAVQSPYRFAIHFDRVPLRTEALLRFPLLNSASPSGSSADVDGASAGEILTRRFHAVRRNENQFLYRRQIPEPDGVPQYHVAEVVETKFESPEQLLQALFRREVDVLPKVLPWHLDLLRKDEQLFVGKYGLPTTHVLQFNPRSEPLANRQLRGALTIGLNRPRILRESVLRSESIRDARLVSTAWPRNSYAYNTLVKPREYDLTLGFTLAVAARKPLGGSIPPLKMVCPPDPVILDAARDIIRQWALLDITVELIPQTADTNVTLDSDEWDIVYRPIRMREPLAELWPFLALDDRARVESLSHLPDWLRQELVELDYAGDWKSAIAALRDLHRQLWQEMLFIPLWELDEFYVLRKTIARPPMLNAELGPLHIYQGVEEWIVR